MKCEEVPTEILYGIYEQNVMIPLSDYVFITVAFLL